MKRTQQKALGSSIPTSSSSSKKCQKLHRLSAVFLKALDVSISAIKKEDVSQCFGNLAEKYGNLIEKALINELGKSRNTLEKIFDELCEVKSLNKSLTSLEHHDSQISNSNKDKHMSARDPVNAYLELVKAEKENVKSSIDQLLASIADLNHRVEHIKTQALEQVAALEEEAKKVAMASEVCN